ncbi:hypothetical protein TUM4644_07350 [Shewanella colwelliana]|uniref:DUF2937 domain-containing protein n=1 Tax=Shewanella colwelliana TaxID=23 RepID=A0ABQ4P483_SHECO|nr:DUF2937 family protein [Shewanella colwelliana]MDX1280752.1 DUF2937 family protein [Shewanella colwelliana]GIU19493.1 hypothetical protein TUM4644_07350 [Shewanella colwelliana]GIU42325.1 hypothetical protein TUM3794_25360 [Shewanella colwelliana]
MIRRLMDYLRLLLFVCGVLLGVQVPAFVDQYGQRLQAHTIEAKHSLAEFQRDADRFFDGDIEKLISHYQQNPDAVINAGGESIHTIYLRYQHLDSALKQFNQTAYSGFRQVAFEPLADIRSEAWHNFTHTIMLDSRAMTIGLMLGLLLAMLCELLLVGAGKCCVSVYRGVFKPNATIEG